MFKLILGILMITTTGMADVPNRKVIVIGEKLIEKNPWRNEVIKQQYTLALAQALQEHKSKYPKTTVALVENFSGGPDGSFELAEKENALGILGYLYSGEAFEAAQIAHKSKIPYLSPVTPLGAVRTDYSYSLATPHQRLKASFLKVRARFNRPSYVVVPDSFLTGFEYARVYEETFDVKKTYKGTATQVWETLGKDLPNLVEKEPINILLAGFAFEQMDLIQSIAKAKLSDRVNLIAHPQWNYCPDLLLNSFIVDVQNFFIVSDYFDQEMLALHNFPVSQRSVRSLKEFKRILVKEPKVGGHSIEEPIVYVLKDMIVMALEAAEQSRTREEFNRFYSTLYYEGASGEYRIRNKESERKVYLGIWDKRATKPLSLL